ncbi:metallophosphoesterase family protein [Roseateles sp. NT4]|uniref:metallophosphoesterase family protein n=1 Tax=Roseateles sp. NT4 TaxID=3453715 RepID=UPI003EEC579F
MIRVGLISDTHGLLRPEALAWLQGSNFIVHAGDIGDPVILDQLRAIAPLTAVRGNNDNAPWGRALPEATQLQAGGVTLQVLHDLAELAIDPRAAGVAAVITGHSHQPRIEHRDGVLFVNPGSAGPRRFRLPIAAGELLIADDGQLQAHTVVLAA